MDDPTTETAPDRAPIEDARARAAELLRAHGGSELGFFQLWPDKRYFFYAPDASGAGPSGGEDEAFIAYAVGAGVAVALGDPVGPADQLEPTVRAFITHCRARGWGVCFHHVAPEGLDRFERLGLRRLKIGDAAIVDLTQFTLAGKQGKNLRRTVNKLEREGVHHRLFRPPLDEALLDQLQAVSDDWLALPDRRERTFAVGRFVRDYVRATPALAALDADERMLAFVNLIPSYRPGEATADLIRRLRDAPGGITDYVFVRLLEHDRDAGLTRFNMGLAPLTAFREDEPSSRTERALHAFLRRLDFLFSYSGLIDFKAKYAHQWEPRYLIYQRQLQLPRVARALRAVTEVGPRERRWFQRRLPVGRLRRLVLPGMTDLPWIRRRGEGG